MKPLEIRRGDIYFLDIPHYTGSEMGKNRPAIVVSCDALNRSSPCVTVVCCSGSNQHVDLPGHVEVTSTPRPSLALCEHIYTVDKSRLGDYLGALSPQELAGVDRGIALGLFGELEGLQVPQKTIGMEADGPELTCAARQGQLFREQADELRRKISGFGADAGRVEAQRDLLRELYDGLLDRVLGESA